MKRTKRTQVDKFMEKQRAFSCPTCHALRDVVHVSEGSFEGLQLVCHKCGDKTRWTVPKNKA